MRELKFRAWDEQKKVMHNDVEFIRSGTEENDWIIFKSDKQKLEREEVLDNPYFQQQLKLMQYTNLKDSRGVEIYEGDIVKTKYQKKAEVCWHDEHACFALRTLDKIVESEYMFCLKDEIEVIGNIYENPELINKTS